MITKYILGGLAVLFLSLALLRTIGGDPNRRAQARTWLLIGVIFGAVSAFLFLQGS